MTFEISQDDYLRKVVADRDALLKALQRIRSCDDKNGHAMKEIAREAIARMEA
jgi:hypothetical protein